MRTAAVPAPPAVRSAAAARQWKPRQVLLAVLVVALGGLVTMWAVGSYSHRDRVLVISANVPVGQRITVDDLVGADLSVDPQVAAIPVAQQGEVIGKVALVDLAKGTLVNPSQVGASPVLAAGQVLVPLQLKAGQLPVVGLAPGQLVQVVAPPVSTGCVPGTDGCRRQRDRACAGLRRRAVTVVAVTGGKAGPGATTAALALGLSWPGPVLLVDADAAGGDMVPGMLPGRVGTERGLLSWLVVECGESSSSVQVPYVENGRLNRAAK